MRDWQKRRRESNPRPPAPSRHSNGAPVNDGSIAWRALLWFVAGIAAMLAGIVAGWVALIAYSLRRWDRERAL